MNQTQQILKHLQAGKSINPMQALNRYGCFRLAARICDLRKSHAIADKWVERNGKKYKVYFIG